jgi:CheY-like chemotaxis protein
MHKILVLDDERSIRVLLTELLTARGFQVRGATDAAEALDLAESFSPDLLIVDRMLRDEVDGFQVAEVLRRLLPELKVIGISGYSSPELGSKASSYDRLVPKPFGPEEIVQAVEEAVKPSA